MFSKLLAITYSGQPFRSQLLRVSGEARLSVWLLWIEMLATLAWLLSPASWAWSQVCSAGNNLHSTHSDLKVNEREKPPSVRISAVFTGRRSLPLHQPQGHPGIVKCTLKYRLLLPGSTDGEDLGSNLNFVTLGRYLTPSNSSFMQLVTDLRVVVMVRSIFIKHLAQCLAQLWIFIVLSCDCFVLNKKFQDSSSFSLLEKKCRDSWRFLTMSWCFLERDGQCGWQQVSGRPPSRLGGCSRFRSQSGSLEFPLHGQASNTTGKRSPHRFLS